MLISEFMKEYSLHGSLITGWNWAEPDLLVLEIDLSHLYQEYYTEDMEDFRQITVIFEGCTLVDRFNEGFNGFSSGDASIYVETEVKESTSLTARQGIELTMQYDNYDGEDRKWIKATIFAKEVSVIDSNREIYNHKPDLA